MFFFLPKSISNDDNMPNMEPTKLFSFLPKLRHQSVRDDLGMGVESRNLNGTYLMNESMRGNTQLLHVTNSWPHFHRPLNQKVCSKHISKIRLDQPSIAVGDFHWIIISTMTYVNGTFIALKCM